MSFLYILQGSNLAHANELVEYYQSYIIEVAELLKRPEKDIPRSIGLCLEEYCKGRLKIAAVGGAI